MSRAHARSVTDTTPPDVSNSGALVQRLPPPVGTRLANDGPPALPPIGPPRVYRHGSSYVSTAYLTSGRSNVTGSIGASTGGGGIARIAWPSMMHVWTGA